MLTGRGTAGQVPADPVVHGPEGERGSRRNAAVFEHPGPLGAGEVGIEHEPGPVANEREMAGLGQLARSAPAVRRSCHTIARWHGRPVDRSQATAVSRWLVIPIAAIVSARSRQLRVQLGEGRLDEVQISAASCSTRPGAGKCWVSSR